MQRKFVLNYRAIGRERGADDPQRQPKWMVVPVADAVAVSLEHERDEQLRAQRMWARYDAPAAKDEGL